MLRRILRELERITAALARILEQMWQLDESLGALLEELEKRKAPAAAEPVEMGRKDPKAWMEEGLSNILGYQPGKKGEE